MSTVTSLAPEVPAPAAQQPSQKWLGLSLVAWVQIAIVSLLMIALFRSNLARLWSKTNPFYGEPNWGHAFVVPLIGLYYLYFNRERLLAEVPQQAISGRLAALYLWGQATALLWMYLAFAFLLSPRYQALTAAVGLALSLLLALPLAIPGTESLRRGMLGRSRSWFGAGIMLWGILFFTWAIYPGQNDFFKDMGMIVTLFGVTLLLAGWWVMRVAWFPIAFLVCSIPWPQLFYSQIAMPLQKLAAEVGTYVLRATGVHAARIGTKIQMGLGMKTRILNVAEACAGLRSLMTFVTVAAAIAFLSNRPLWHKIIITLSAIPIAIACNVMRVAGQGLLDHYVSTEWSESFAHQFVGLFMLTPAFFLILLVGWVLDRLFIEEADMATVGATGERAARNRPAVIEVKRRPQPLASGRSTTAPAAKPLQAQPVARVAAAPADVPLAPQASTAADEFKPAAPIPPIQPMAPKPASALPPKPAAPKPAAPATKPAQPAAPAAPAAPKPAQTMAEQMAAAAKRMAAARGGQPLPRGAASTAKPPAARPGVVPPRPVSPPGPAANRPPQQGVTTNGGKSPQSAPPTPAAQPEKPADGDTSEGR